MGGFTPIRSGYPLHPGPDTTQNRTFTQRAIGESKKKISPSVPAPPRGGVERAGSPLWPAPDRRFGLPPSR